jgi:low affinity Fe/Cu permease
LPGTVSVPGNGRERRSGRLRPCRDGYRGGVERRKDPIDAARPPRRRSSHLIDRVSDLLGREATFAAIVVSDLVVVAAVATVGVRDTAVVSAISLAVSLVTLVMVCAVQHTSSRESKALNLKLDEIIRVSEARNELIGAEDESHSQLATHAGRLRERHGPPAGDTR